MKTKNKTFSYPVLFTPAPEGGFDVSFPDFPGCVTFGDTYEEAKKMAIEALTLWIETLQEQHESIPRQPSRPIMDELQLQVA